MTADTRLRIGLAAARNAPSVEERLQTVHRFLDEAAAQDVAVVCFPEAYIPGLARPGLPGPAPGSTPPGIGPRGGSRRGRAAPAWPSSSEWNGNPPPGCTTWRS